MKNRQFLLSLLVLPACEANVPSESDPRTPGDGDPDKIESSCRAFYNGYTACYSDAYDTEGYGTASYDTETYDPAEYIEQLCSQVEEYAEMYGSGCAAAMQDAFACMSLLDCGELFSDDAAFPEPCQAVFLDASERCPELFSQCSTVSGGFGGGCEVEVSGCIDGNTYAVNCDPSGATQQCSCVLNGESTREVTLSGDAACGDEGWYDEAADACGFPRGAF